MGKDNEKAQVWFTDFVIGMFIFTFMLIGYYTYTTNISKQDSLVANDLISDAESVSSSLLLAGFPDDWDSTTVQSIGITNNNQRINKTKFNEFMEINYNKSKKLFGTVYNYFVFFSDENNTVLNVEGSCGTGDPRVNATYNIKSAYFYTSEEYIKEFMEDKLNADVYTDEDTFINNIDNYALVVLEHPNLQLGYRDELEDYASSGGLLLLSGQVLTANNKIVLGVKYYKETGLATDDENATVLVEDEFLTFEEGQNITFVQAYYVINDSIASENFTRIARFVNPSITDPDENNAVARWKYGNGSVLFFSDFDANYFKEDFIDALKSSITNWARVECNPVSLSNVQYTNLVKIERIVIYNSKPVKMVLYLWQ